MQEKEKIAEAQAEGGTCQCQPLAANGVTYLTAVKPARGSSTGRQPNLGTCRLTIEDKVPGTIKGVERSHLIAAGRSFEEGLALTEASPAHRPHRRQQ